MKLLVMTSKKGLFLLREEEEALRNHKEQSLTGLHFLRGFVSAPAVSHREVRFKKKIQKNLYVVIVVVVVVIFLTHCMTTFLSAV